MLDVRAIANFVLDQASKVSVPVSNMALNKIVYFVHCDYLIEKGEALVGAKIEAWQHGPVFREIYHEFKRWDDRPIQSRASKVDPTSGDVVQASVKFGAEEEKYIVGLVDRYLRFSAAQLRAISHLSGGPWHVVWGHDGQANPGMRITNEIIKEHYSSGARQ
ncbi:MAG: Panacea domain-containing protein [Sphingorhabdus sp.]